jgi:hypothetical protein
VRRTEAILIAPLATLLVASLGAAGCAPLATSEQRPARSSLSCMRAAIADQDLADLPDAQAHCIAAGLIARRCSVSESMLASLGKEIEDLLGAGDAEWRDLGADRRGMNCARRATSDTDLRTCCENPQ